MTSLCCYGNSDLAKIHCSRNFGLSLARVWKSGNLLYYVLVRRILYLKLEGVNAIPRCGFEKAIYMLKKGFAFYTQDLAMTPKHLVRLNSNDTYSDASSLP